MKKLYRFNVYYRMFPLIAIALLLFIALIDGNGNERNAVLTFILPPILLLFVIIQFDHVSIDEGIISRVSYIVWCSSISISDLTQITFPMSWGASPDARTLVISTASGKRATLTDMAYSRPVLAEIAATLLRRNPRIQIDADTRNLLALIK